MTSQGATLPELITAITGAVVAILGALAAGYAKLAPKIKSTDNAVNHGRMERIETQLAEVHSARATTDRDVDNLEQRIDALEATNVQRHDELVGRLDSLMLTLIKD